MSNYGRLSEGLKLYRDSMRSFIAWEVRRVHSRGDWMEQGVYPNLRRQQADNLRTAIANASTGILQGMKPNPEDYLDIHHFRDIVRGNWNQVFSQVFKDNMVLDWINEVGRERHIWAHPPAGDLEQADVNRVLDSCSRVLAYVDKDASQKLAALRDIIDAPASAVATPETPAAEASQAGDELLASRRVRGLKPWRDVIAPHPDVAAGRYVQAEFAADLAQVLEGKADAEYQEPVEFFQRTYLTPVMQQLLSTALERLAGREGDPVVELKTAFGGGKTHTMLALYHLTSGSNDLAKLKEVRNLLQEHGLDKLGVVA